MPKQNKGFTLMELIIVIAIIGILSTVGILSLDNLKARARNSRRLSDIRKYVTAINTIANTTESYPYPGDLNWKCLGNYPDNACGLNGTGYPEEAALNAMIDDYLPGLPIDTLYAKTSNYEGYVYSCTNYSNSKCTARSIRWFMEGTSQLCGIGISYGDSYGTTYCGHDESF